MSFVHYPHHEKYTDQQNGTCADDQVQVERHVGVAGIVDVDER